jgi:hypothetical protein
MFRIEIRFAHGLALAAVVAILAAPATALGKSSPTKAPADWFERYAAAHPFGHGTTAQGNVPDWLERFAAAHPYGAGTGLVASTVVDGRSPDTRDAAAAPTALVAVPPGGFDWGDAGIGAGFGSAFAGLLAVTALLWMRRHVRHRVQTS